MLAFLAPFLGIFKSPKFLMYGGAALLAAFIGWKVWGFIEDKYAAELEVARLSTVILEQREKIETLRLAFQTAKQAAEIAEKARKEIESQIAESDGLIDEIRNRGDEDDGEVAPVLRGALDALGRLRD